eukprot:SAG22_NODE_2088_length_3030_cov_7.531900_4_plen_160_part_00
MCSLFGPAEEGLEPMPYLRYDTNLTAIKKNNNTYDHYGEMAMWQMRAAAAYQPAAAATAAPAKKVLQPAAVTTATGLKIEVLRPAPAATAGQKPAASDTVRVDYEGRLAADGSVFDSSYKRGQPIEFPLSGVIAGWTEGLQVSRAACCRPPARPAHCCY